MASATAAKRDVWAGAAPCTVSIGEMLTPIGALRIVAGPRGVLRIDLPNTPPPQRNALRAYDGTPLRVVAADARVAAVKAQLRAYFAGKRTAFELPLDLRGGAFDRVVWRAVAKIGFGRVATYGDIARRIGNARAVRAVGAANGRNPVPIVIPCHRIVGADGRLTGYGGGVGVKALLLRLEGFDLPGEATRATRVNGRRA